MSLWCFHLLLTGDLKNDHMYIAEYLDNCYAYRETIQ